MPSKQNFYQVPVDVLEEENQIQEEIDEELEEYYDEEFEDYNEESKLKTLKKDDPNEFENV